MADSAPNEFRRRYARPGELDPSILETHSVEKRPEVPPNPNLKPPPPSTGTVESKAILLRQSIELNSNLKSSVPPTRTVESKSIPLRQSELNPNLKSPAPPPGIVEAKSLQQGPAVRPTPSNKSSTPPTGIGASKSIPLRQSVELNRKSPTPLTGKGAISSKRVAARFELLPDQKSRWGRMGLSAVGQLVTLGLLLLSPTVFPQTMQTALKFDVVELMQPVTEILAPTATPPPPPRPKIKPKTPPRPPEIKPEVPEPPPVLPQLSPRQPHVFLMLKPELRKVHTVEEKPVELKPVLAQTEIVLKTNEPKPPKEDVKIGNLSSGGSPAPATVAAPANKVQTGGFGDPNGIPGPGNPNRAGNINQAGSPQLPGGPGYGNGSGGAQGVRGTVASEGPRKSAPVTGGVTASVDILSMPNPVYSDEGRTLRMEGDVVLEVVFLASGQVQVTRVVSGLGHGLDEAAIQAAKQIHFRPAKRDGLPVDSPARVRIEFRLAK